jgi:hypothetical protein
MIYVYLVESTRNRGLYLTNDAVVELKEGVMVVYGE